MAHLNRHDKYLPKNGLLKRHFQNTRTASNEFKIDKVDTRGRKSTTLEMLQNHHDEFQKQIDIGQDKDGKTLTIKEIARMKAKVAKKLSAMTKLRHT